jgi:hypothetical protein
MNVAVLVLTLVVVAYAVYLYGHNKKSYIRGLWYMTPEFCTSGGVDSTIIIIGDDDAVVKVSSGGQLVETKFDYKLSEDIASTFHPYKARYTLTIGDDNELGYPATMTCEMDICAGTMCWYLDDIEYADLRRVHA